MNADPSRLPARPRPILDRANRLTVLGLIALILGGCRPAPESEHRHLLTRSPERYTVHARRAVAPETVTIRNLGEQTVVDPRIVVNGRKDWFDTDSILAEILEPGMSKRDKAVAIWRFVVDNRTHDQPVHHHVEAHDPARFFNVYGYGFCDDAATNFMVLAEKARVSSRVWTLEGHVVAEARYDRSWHMFDADAEVYYLAEDGRIAGVEELADNPALIRRHPSPLPQFPTEDLVNIYSSREDNRVAGWYRVNSEARHAMAFSLRPGESLVRSRDNWGLFVASRTGSEPAAYGNGRFTFVPVLRDEIYRQGALGAAGVTATATGQRRGLIFTGEAGEAYIAYPFTSPYPILSARARIKGELLGDGDAWLDYSEDGRRRVNLWATSAAGGIDVEISLDSQLRRDSGRPVYGFRLTLGHTANAAGAAWHVERLQFESDFQHAPKALPELDKGDNEMRYIDGGGEGIRKVEVVFDYGQ